MAPLHGRMIDAWMQHPTARFRAQPIFDPLRRWFPTANLAADDEIPLAATIEAMDAGGVCLGLVCAWDLVHLSNRGGQDGVERSAWITAP